jgi:hypothetical protein
MYVDILLGLANGLLNTGHEKNRREYIHVKQWVENKVFPCELNSIPCALHDGAHVVASATYEYTLQPPTSV